MAEDNRKTIASFTIDPRVQEMLVDIAKSSGQTKSAVVEKAILTFTEQKVARAEAFLVQEEKAKDQRMIDIGHATFKRVLARAKEHMNKRKTAYIALRQGIRTDLNTKHSLDCPLRHCISKDNEKVKCEKFKVGCHNPKYRDLYTPKLEAEMKRWSENHAIKEHR